jgi:hypothetical protein
MSIFGQNITVKEKCSNFQYKKIQFFEKYSRFMQKLSIFGQNSNFRTELHFRKAAQPVIFTLLELYLQ